MNFHQPLTGWTWGGNRMDLAVKLATGKSVLHVGHVDDGMDGRKTLHEKLSEVSTKIIGADVVLPNPDSKLYAMGGSYIFDFQVEKWDPLQDDWPIDLVVCTEVLEHVGNVMSFLTNLRSVGAKEYLFTVPNAFSAAHNDEIRRDVNEPQVTYMGAKYIPTRELVHPDHNCWFSPYTLENVLRKAGYTAIDKWMVGWNPPASLFTAEGCGILAK